MNDEFGSFSYGKKDMDTGNGSEQKLTAYRPEPYERPAGEQVNIEKAGAVKSSSYPENLKTNSSNAEHGYDGTADKPASYGYSGTTLMKNSYGTAGNGGYVAGGNSSYGAGANSSYGARVNSSYVSYGNNSFGSGVNDNNGSYGNIPKTPDDKKPVSHQRKNRKTGNGRKILVTAGLALVFGVISSGVFIGMNKIFGDKKEGTDIQSSTIQSASADSIATQAAADLNGGTTNTISYDVAEIVKKAQPSTVSITTTVTTSYQYYFQQYERESTGAGSGIIIGKTDDLLYIATNYHVIEKAKEINVGFNDGQIIKAKVTGYDANADVAVVQVKLSDIPEATAKVITVAITGDSDALQVGEPAIAIGNAMGYGQSVTVGYISALNRSISGNTGSYIQTDAAINPGNSGGALFNAKGEVIGINSIKYVDSKVEGMGFSIPINKAMSIINNLIENGTTGRIYIGVSGANVTSEYSQIYGFPIGIYVKNINSGSPAEKAGLRTGDIITAVNGATVTTMDEMTEALQKYKAGDEVELSIYRANNNGQYSRGSVTVTVDHE